MIDAQEDTNVFSAIGLNGLNGDAMTAAFGTGKKAVDGFIGRLINIQDLRRYFAVSTDYVLNKLKLVLFPYTYHGSYQRRVIPSTIDGKTVEPYPPPRADINAPDLYIPVMGFVTYVILCAVVAGLAGGFRPEMLSLKAVTALIAAAISALFLYCGFWVLTDTRQPFLDCLAFCGYVFVGVALNEFAVLFGGRWLLYPCIVFTGAGLSYFLMHTIRVILISNLAPSRQSYDTLQTTDPTMDQKKTRQTFLIILAVLQFLVMYALAFTPALLSAQSQNVDNNNPLYGQQQQQQQPFGQQVRNEPNAM